MSMKNVTLSECISQAITVQYDKTITEKVTHFVTRYIEDRKAQTWYEHEVKLIANFMSSVAYGLVSYETMEFRVFQALSRVRERDSTLNRFGFRVVKLDDRADGTKLIGSNPVIL